MSPNTCLPEECGPLGRGSDESRRYCQDGCKEQQARARCDRFQAPWQTRGHGYRLERVALDDDCDGLDHVGYVIVGHARVEGQADYAVEVLVSDREAFRLVAVLVAVV